MDPQELQEKLDELRARYRETYARGFFTVDNPIRAKLDEEILSCERSLAGILGEEFAVVIDWPTLIGRHDPSVLCDGCRTFLIYCTGVLVEFQGCEAVQFGTPNDEVFEGHRLFGRGLEIGRAHTVCNSRWLLELEKINSIHSQYSPSHWKKLNHYLLSFKERTFECVALGVRATRISGSPPDVLRQLYNAESWDFTTPPHLDSIFER